MLEYRRTFCHPAYTNQCLSRTKARLQSTNRKNRYTLLSHRWEIGEMASYCANRHSYQSKCNGGPCEPRIADTVSSDACGAVWQYCKTHILSGTYLLQTQFQAYASIKVTWLQLNPHQQSQKMLPHFSEANSEKPYLTCLISQHSFC